MSGTLYVVATPIGNLEDVTLRALSVLRRVDLIAAEDTRRTSHLLARHGIATPTISFHKHNVRARIPPILSRLHGGEHIALVTDAGTPGISDPGAELVGACVRAGLAVEPVPGVSAPLAAAVVSGFPLTPLTIFGFPPRRSKERKAWLSELSLVLHTVTFFESPRRLRQTLGELAKYLGDRQVTVGREITKVHQQFLRGTATELQAQLQTVQGEATVVIGPKPTDIRSITTSERDTAVALAVEYFWHLTDIGLSSRREAVVGAARRFGLPARAVYDAVERAKRLD